MKNTKYIKKNALRFFDMKKKHIGLLTSVRPWIVEASTSAVFRMQTSCSVSWHLYKKNNNERNIWGVLFKSVIIIKKINRKNRNFSSFFYEMYHISNKCVLKMAQMFNLVHLRSLLTPILRQTFIPPNYHIMNVTMFNLKEPNINNQCFP